MSDAFLDFRGVRFEAGGRTILRGIDLTVNEGETIVLLGRSGSGKTTLLKCVNRLVEPTGGSIVFDGKPVLEWDAIELRRRIGYVIQDGGLLPHLTVAANVGLVPALSGWPESRTAERVQTLLASVGLEPERFASRKPASLSGGEKQRVGIARALAADPPLLLLDEPFAALDPVTRFDLQRMFRRLRAEFGKTALFVTHDIREALMMGSRIALLHDGRLIVLAPPDEFAASDAPEARAFLESLDYDRKSSL